MQKKYFHIIALGLMLSNIHPALAIAEAPQSLPLRNPFQPGIVTTTPNSVPSSVLGAPSLANDNFRQFKLSFVKAADIKEALQAICSTSKISAEPTGNILLCRGSISELNNIQQLITALDKPTSQVSLEAKVISLSKENSKNLGLTWSWEDIPQHNKKTSNNSTNNPTGGSFKFWHGYSFNFGARLNALITKGEAKVLAAPHIITIPGKEGSIFIGDHIPYQIDKHDSGGTYTSTEYIDAGISLKYVPLLNKAEDMITASVQTEVSTPTLVSELKNYKVTSRKAETTVRMRSGETLVLGGLITAEEQRTLQKIPVLGDLPLLGRLFQNKSHRKEQTEIILLLTPYISKPGEAPNIYRAKATKINNFPLSKG